LFSFFIESKFIFLSIKNFTIAVSVASAVIFPSDDTAALLHIEQIFNNSPMSF